jgi:LysM repeat protein
MSVQMNLRRQNRAADLGHGLLALAGVLVLVVGVPAALLAWVGSPLPAAMPQLSEITAALRDTYIPDEFLLNLLALVCWLAWIELVASLLVEAVAYARGGKAGTVPLAGGLQRAAARLVAAVALLGAVVATKGMPEPAARPGQPLVPAPHPVVMLAGAGQPAFVGEAVPAHPEAAAAPVAAPTYQVQRRDTLWDIAERHLGDPFRWQEIFQLNEGCPQADGRCLTDPDLIFAGWRLQLPADAVGLGSAVAPAPAPPSSPSTPGAAGASPSGNRAPEVIDGGVVLIDDGAPEVGGDVLLASDTLPVDAGDGIVRLPGGAGDGVVRLPGDASGQGADEPAVLAGPPGRTSGSTPGTDEMAGTAGPAGAPARSADND